jgi:hypothetical protein
MFFPSPTGVRRAGVILRLFRVEHAVGINAKAAGLLLELSLDNYLVI